MLQLRIATCLFLGLTATAVAAQETPKESTKGAAKEAAPERDDPNGDDRAVRRCLNVWGDKHPFKGQRTPPYTEISTNVKVLGAGGPLEDKSDTKEPKLVLVKPSVAVMSKNVIKLLNPNGWYCLKANVTVMAKTVIEIACTASIADSTDGVAVLGSNAEGTGQGVTVLGKTELKRVGCATK